MIHTIVIAGNHRIYEHYLSEKKLSRNEVRYVNRPEQLRGLRGVRVVLLHEWEKNACAKDRYVLRIVSPECKDEIENLRAIIEIEEAFEKGMAKIAAAAKANQ